MSCPFMSANHSQAQDAGPDETLEIPQPPEHLFGLARNYMEIDPAFPASTHWRLAGTYGPIYKLRLGAEIVVLSNREFVNEICDEDRFEKVPNPVLVEVRALLGDGLFTAFPHEINWWKAHRILVPVFGAMSIRKMFPDMLDISSQMVLKWDRQGEHHEIDCSDDLTRLAFDTIGLCAFGYRFNEFYSEHVHPFAQQMAEVLIESGKRASRPAIANQFYYRSEQHRQENVAKMFAVCDEIIAERKKNPKPDATDLLNTMLYAKDPETGEGLSDETIRYNLCTFLVAGHETTSGTLSFTYLNLLKHPDKLFKAQKEVDEVVGDNALELKHLPQLKYIDACVKETLRLSAPINAFIVKPKQDTKLAGKYPVTKEMFMQANIRILHRDRTVWGDDVEVFRPERMLDGGFERLPPNAWKPFGNGMRGCIGRGFAEQEMLLNIALVLQRFQIELADPSYELKMKSTLTIKPDGFRMKVRRRPGRSIMVGLSDGASSKANASTASRSHCQEPEHTVSSDDEGRPISVFYGGNSGTCKAFAQEIETQAAERGYKATVLGLDAGAENLPTDRPVVIITASYEGKPPDNARKFVSWLEHLQGNELKDVNYTVFGVGNSDWASTFHRIPKLVNDTMQKLGASRFLDAGFTDAKRDLIGPFEDWSEALWKGLQPHDDSTRERTELNVTIQANPAKKTLDGEEIHLGTVISNIQISSDEPGPVKRHMEVVLPEGMSYAAGDYLVVLPRNHPETVSRVLRQFGLNGDDLITVNGSKKQFLPSEAMPVEELLSSAVELNLPITKRQLEILVSFGDTERLKDNYDELIEQRFSVLDVLEDHPIPLPFATYLDMLSPLAPRQYSISSSPLAEMNPGFTPRTSDPFTKIASITYDVLDSPSWAHPRTTQHYGVASSYLASRRIGDRISCFVRSTNASFRLPADLKTPVVMIAAGTGLAPMRAFLQERAAIAAAKQLELGPALLFFGCKDPEKDFIFKEELKRWEDEGVVKVYPAFSRVEYKHKYVHDAMWAERETVCGLWKDGAKVLVCGRATSVGKSAGEVIKKMWMEKTGRSEEEAGKWLDEVREVRYVSDVFG